MKFTFLDKIALISLWVAWLMGIFIFNEMLIVISSICLLQYALAEKIIEAIKNKATQND